MSDGMKCQLRHDFNFLLFCQKKTALYVRFFCMPFVEPGNIFWFLENNFEVTMMTKTGF